MRKQTTERQKELLSVIYEYIRSTGYPPSFEEMRQNLGVASNQSIIDLLEKLKKRDLIKRNEPGARKVVILPMGYEVLGRPSLAPFLGIASAGIPLEMEEIKGEWESLPGNVAKLKDEVFLIKVSGDSMINAGIEDGDMVLVKRHKEFVSGDIVLARVGDSSTIKRFISEDKPPYVYLKPENPNYRILLFTDDTTLEGKAISVLKSGYWKSIK